MTAIKALVVYNIHVLLVYMKKQPVRRLTMLTDDTKVSVKAETDEGAGVNVDTCTVGKWVH